MTGLEITGFEWALVGPRIVGAVLIWTGFIKAVAPSSFRQHLQSLGWLPTSLLAPTTTFAAGFEAGIGAALVVGFFPSAVLPTAIAMLVVLSLISWLGVKTGKASDCGCYGGFIQPSIWQSLGLNGLFAVLLIPAWTKHFNDVEANTWQTVTVLWVAAIACVLTYVAQRYEAKNGRALIDTNPMKVGAKWRHSWAQGATSQLKSEILVTMLGPDCPYCKSWIRVGNAIGQSARMPAVVGVVAANRKKVDTFISEQGILFPIATISPSLMNRLVVGVPTTVHVVSGRIKEIWVGEMPPEFVDRMRDAFFPDAVPDVPARLVPASAGTA